MPKLKNRLLKTPVTYEEKEELAGHAAQAYYEITSDLGESAIEAMSDDEILEIVKDHVYSYGDQARRELCDRMLAGELNEVIRAGVFGTSITKTSPTKPSPLEKKYPKSVALAKKADPDGYGEWTYILAQRNPQLALEKYVVYTVFTQVGPDVAYEKLGRILPKVRKAAGGDILAAYEKNKLRDIIEEMYEGPASDKLRNPGDKYF
jgi:hypothetical protein